MSERPRVFVTRRLPGDAVERVREVADVEIWPGDSSPDPGALRAGATAADGLLCLLTDPIDATLLGACPRLRVVSSCSVGVDHIDVAAATRRGIPVGHTPGVLAETTADLAFALLLVAARRVGEAERWLRGGGWTEQRRWDPEGFVGRDVHGATLGVIGLGAIGRAVAQRARGFGMHVLGWTRSARRVEGVEAAPLSELLRRSDFVSVHLALTEETGGLLDAAALEGLKPGAVLINTARGGIVDEAALCAALRSGKVAAAALDVFESEPIDPSSPLLTAPNLVLTPHIGSASIATRTRMADLAVENLLAGLAGQPLPHAVNPEAMGQAEERRRS